MDEYYFSALTYFNRLHQTLFTPYRDHLQFFVLYEFCNKKLNYMLQKEKIITDGLDKNKDQFQNIVSKLSLIHYSYYYNHYYHNFFSIMVMF